MTSLPGPPEFAQSKRPGDLSAHVARLLAGETLSEADAAAAFEAMMSGASHHAEMGALLALLATRLPTVDELVGAARVLRQHVTRVPTTIDPDSILDTAGTGGAVKTFNVSTAAAIVAASGGAKVAKHGNRSRTGRGSAEVLERIGVNVAASGAVQARCLEEVGFCFCFAIHHHPATKHAMPVRQALPFPTIFNLLGPLTNPAGARRQIIGVYDRKFVTPMAEALARLGATRAFVMHSGDGLDEFSIGAVTRVAEVEGDHSVREFDVDPRKLGLQSAAPAALAPKSLDEAARLFESILRGDERGPARDMTLLSSAAALLVAGLAADWEEGIRVAAQLIDFGDAWGTVERLREVGRR